MIGHCRRLLIAISAAIDGFFRYGERRRHYRLIVERLKIEGWQFLQLSGPNAHQRSHAAAHPEFAAQVEEILRSDVQQYITELVREKQAPAEHPGARADHPRRCSPPGRHPPPDVAPARKAGDHGTPHRRHGEKR